MQHAYPCDSLRNGIVNHLELALQTTVLDQKVHELGVVPRDADVRDIGLADFLEELGDRLDGHVLAVAGGGDVAS